MLAVRPLTAEDIPYIEKYWRTRSPETLVLMGVDAEKLQPVDFNSVVGDQLSLPIENRSNFYVIWMMDGKPIGHSNVGKLSFGEEATMHLHVWDAEQRQRGVGTAMVLKSLKLYFDTLQLKRVICEPNALNEAPNKTLTRAGFDFIKRYEPEPGYINFPHTQNRWEMSKEKFESL